MNAAERIKRSAWACDLLRVVRDLRLETRGEDGREERGPNRVKVRCPWHQEKSPSCSLTIGPEGTLRAHCFGACDRTGDIHDLVAAYLGLDAKKKPDWPKILAEGCSLSGEAPDGPEARTAVPRRAAEILADAAREEPPPDPDDGAGADKLTPSEIRDLWERCAPCADDAAVAGWLASRGLDATALDTAGLARALPLRGELPRWAAFWRWSGVYRCIVPLYDARGELVSLKARAVAPPPDGGEKVLSPLGGRLRGTMLTDPLARLVLQAKGWPWTCAAPVVMVMEGEVDFWAMVTRPKHRDNGPPARWATIGLPGASGGWTRAWAAAWPAGTTLRVWPDRDLAGEKATDKIVNDCRRYPLRVEVVDLGAFEDGAAA